MSRKIGNAQSRTTFFRHSAVLSLPAVLLRKLAILIYDSAKKTTFVRGWQIFPPFLKFVFIFSQGRLFEPKCLTYNGLVVASVPTLCMFLKRYAYPCRYGDLVCHFARPVPELSIITNHMMDLIYGRWHHLLTRYNHDLLSPPKLLQYAQVIEQAGAALDNCWGFVDGTVRPVCRPSENQRAIYNGHKRIHSIKSFRLSLYLMDW